MGLDGVSINQLSIVPNRSSNDLNSVSFALNGEVKAVDGLSSGQKVDPDKENEKQKHQLKKNFASSESEEENTEENEHNEHVIRYDLSKTEKYALKVDDETNEILIIEKSTNDIVQRINADELSRFISFLPGTKGAIVNRKF